MVVVTITWCGLKLPNWNEPSILIMCTYTNTMYTHMDGDHWQHQTLYETNCQAVFTMTAYGCKVIDCSWIRIKQSSSGAAIQGVIGTYQTVTAKSMQTKSSQSLLPTILVSLWTVRYQGDPIYLMLLHCFFQCNAPDTFNIKIATIRYEGGRCSLPVSFTLG